MQFVPFEEWHMDHINRWLTLRGFPAKNHLQELPEIGFVALKEFFPVACAFLRRCEGGVGILEGLATDPEAPGKDRSDAIDGCVTRVLHTADELGMSRIIAWSKESSVIERSKKHGFEKSEATLIFRKA